MLPGLLFAASLALTLGLATWSLQRNAAERLTLLEHRAETLRQALARSVRGQLDLLPALRLAASGPVPLDDARFSRYADSVLGSGRYPGLILSFVADRVSPDGLAAYLQRVHADRSADPAGHPSFGVQPPGERPEYMLLRHQFPADPTNDGYDLYDPAQPYRPAVERAIAVGDLVATPPLLLARDRHRPSHPELTSIVVRAAFYRDGRLPAGREERRAAASGVVGIAFRSAELVRSALPADLAARVRVTDASNPLPVYDSEPGAALTPPAVSFDLPVADRHWRVELTPPVMAWWQHADEATWALLALGLVSAAALATLALRPTAAVPNAAAPPGEARWRLLFEQSHEAVLNTRPGGGIVAANPTACALFGRSEAELRAAARADILDLADPRLAALMTERATRGQAQGRLRMRRRDGRSFEADISVVTQLDSQGRELASVIVRPVESDEEQVLADWN
ncbi:CHASE domain-containing protein [Roseateles sp. NT4]|uniref:CHASE domain-containing protein n=1 Tax=Roseateles sp. NT4 TaxID=3453715 RepID=UPI003EE8F343